MIPSRFYGNGRHILSAGQDRAFRVFSVIQVRPFLSVHLGLTLIPSLSATILADPPLGGACSWLLLLWLGSVKSSQRYQNLLQKLTTDQCPMSAMK